MSTKEHLAHVLQAAPGIIIYNNGDLGHTQTQVFKIGYSAALIRGKIIIYFSRF